MHDHGGAVIKRTAQYRGSGVVDDQRHTFLAADLGDFGDREYFEFRIGERFRVITTGPRVGRSPEILRIGRMDKWTSIPIVFIIVLRKRFQVPP